jgi:hypothetical protein
MVLVHLGLYLGWSTIVGFLLEQPALWGFAGAFIYAAPKFSACYWQCRDTQVAWTRCLADAIICLMIGTISAFAFSEVIGLRLKFTGGQELRAISVLIGLLSNRLAPKLVDGAEGFLTKKLDGAK